MSYGRAPNLTHYLRNLNTPEAPVDETPFTDDDLAKELAPFLNTQFLDFETGQNTDFQAPPVKPDVARVPSSAEDVLTPTDTLLDDFSPNMDFMTGDFSFGDFGSTYTSPTIPSFPDSLGNLQPIQPTPQPAYAPPVSHQPGPPNRILSFEEASRLAAEEDKRKRNTAASARFRIKKKQKEQALEKSAKENAERIQSLEGRIQALETENKWLKSLVTEKHGGKDDILEMLKKFSAKKGSDHSSKDSDSGSSSSSTAADESDSKKSGKRKD